MVAAHLHVEKTNRTVRIRELNDLLRATFAGGKVLVTAAVAELDEATRWKVINTARTFNAFTRHNDPYGTHDCFFFQVDGQRFYAKVECYNETMEYGSDDPSDPHITARVLTIGDAASF